MTSIIEELILEDELKSVSISKEEQERIVNEFREQQNIQAEESFLSFLEARHLDTSLLAEVLTRPSKIVKYREERWGARANSLYLKNKEKYDLVVYNRLQCSSPDVMQEVFFRLKDKEETWDSLAKQIKVNENCPSARIGPVPITDVEQELIDMMRAKGPGKIIRPISLGSEFAVVELEEFKPSNFDQELRSRIIREEFESWLKNECNKMMSKVSYSK